MSGWLGGAGWAAAAVAVVLAAWFRRQLACCGEEVARACHEVRGPLTAARLGLTLGQRMGRLEPYRLRALDQELERAVRAIEDLEKGRRRSVAPQSEQTAVDVHTLLADSVSAWEAAAAVRGRGLRLRWSGSPVTVWGDRVRLAQALGNLIANAIEHGGDGPVDVRGSRRGETARIEVCDRGPGLEAPVAELARRRPGNRGRPRARGRPRDRGRGSDRGRGLAIASSIAVAHGGRLSGAPSESGARLVLTLPLRAGQPRLLSEFGRIYRPNSDS